MHNESTNDIEKGSAKVKKGHKITGILLSVIGFLWLTKKAGWMPDEAGLVQHHGTGGIFLPVVLITSGLLLIFGLIGRHRRQ